MTGEQIAKFIQLALDEYMAILAPRIARLEERIRQLEERPQFERPNGGR